MYYAVDVAGNPGQVLFEVDAYTLADAIKLTKDKLMEYAYGTGRYIISWYNDDTGQDCERDLELNDFGNLSIV